MYFKNEIGYYMIARLAILLQIILFTVNGYTQSVPKQYQFRHLDIAKGLSSSQITCVFKDSRGFVWIGTILGLNRYDGSKFKVFTHSTKDTAGLDDNYIARIMELPGGKLLIETHNGPNIYNPATEKFEHNLPVLFNSLSLPATSPNKIIKTREGDFYFFQYNQGLFKYSGAGKKTTRIIGKADTGLRDITQNMNGDFWLVYTNGVIKKLNGKTGQLVYSSDALSNYNNRELFRYAVISDNDDQLWIYAVGQTQGVYNFRPLTNQLVHISQEQGPYRLNTNLVRGIVQADNNYIWICTDHGGINVVNKKDNSIQYVINNADENNSLSQNSITAAYRDNDGIIWIGTYKKGINCYHESIIKFPLYRHQASKPNSLPYDDVNRFAEDKKGNLWIGTNGGGLIYFDRKNSRFKQYRHRPSSSNSLSSDVIVSLYIDSKQKLWIGTYFGGLDCFDGKIFTHYKHNPADSNSLADNKVYDICEDKTGNIWVGTLGGGLDKFDTEKNIFHHYTPDMPNSVNSGFISVITENNQGDIWVGTATGLSVLEKSTNQFVSYLYSAADPYSLSNNHVLSICTDSKNRTWVGTSDGLNLFKKKTKTFQHFTMQDGLPGNAVLDILEDDRKNIWISTPNGISNLTVVEPASPDSNTQLFCKNFNQADGLQGTEFNDNAAFKTRNGELIFGGADGFNIFNPESISSVNTPPQIVLTDFQVFNKTVVPGEALNGKIILPQSINETQTVILKYNQNDIALEFAALTFANAEKNNYAYKLQGFSDDWVMADGKTRKAVFTNLDPGNYTFYVKTANDKGGWNDNVKKLEIVILPAFWRTAYAYTFYVCLIATVLYIGRVIIIRKARSRFAIEQERIEAQRMHELDLMKIKFFTNVSHEFRTPLSLILAPVDQMLRQTNIAPHRQQLNMVYRNAKRLLNLVNQLMDFRKMEEKELKLQPRQGDIIQFISEISFFFSDVAEKKHISFSFHSNADSLATSFDHDKIERIIFNLLSNAFKFTAENGHVGVVLNITQDLLQPGYHNLTIQIKDTGIGIEPGMQEKIFERFFQNDLPGSMVNQGSGIGLSITKEFVKLHGGTIRVESEPGKGSCFIIDILMIATAAKPPEKEAMNGFHTFITNPVVLAENEADAMIVAENTTAPEPALVNSKKRTILLIEDNEDFLFYLKDNLKQHFAIVEAINGKLGWQKALAAHPDLIVSDISMPEMTGTELCKKIKTDKRTKHIPVILLTALSGEDQQLKGLETGANDYMTKPFNFEILLSKIRNLLNQQEQSKKTYQKQVTVIPTEVTLESPNEKFMQQLLALVEKKIPDPDFSVEEMSREMFMSRVALYKKVFLLTGKTPIELLRRLRLQRAAQLLGKSQLTVSEVAYETGFNNPKYFTKSFQLEFGILPSAYIKENRINK